MDCIFNKRIPKVKTDTIILKPIHKTFISGLSSSYDERYPTELTNFMSEVEFKEAIRELNDCLFYY